MSLFQISISTSLIFLILGLYALFNRENITNKMLAFGRSNKAAVILLTLSLAWFIFRYVRNLSEADFGNYKLIIGLVAFFIYFGSFALVKDFLAVRSACIVWLFYAREVLDSAWLQDPPGRLILVTVTYFFITLALYLGAWPFRFRDFFEWLSLKKKRPVILSFVVLFTGLLTLVASFSL
jgi:hypothetical protein